MPYQGSLAQEVWSVALAMLGAWRRMGDASDGGDAVATRHDLGFATSVVG